MWRKFVFVAVVLSVAGVAAVSYAQFGGGGRKGGRRKQPKMSEKQRQRRQRIQKLRQQVERAPKAMDSHKGAVYMVKQGQLLKLNEELEEQQSTDLGRTFRPQVAAEADRVFVATYESVTVYDTDLNETTSVEADSIGRGAQSGQRGMGLPGGGGQ